MEKILETQRKEYQNYLGVLGEKFESQMKILAESVSGIQQQLIAIREMVAKNTENIEIMKSDIQFIKKELKQKPDIDEFRSLEKRVMLLERKIRTG